MLSNNYNPDVLNCLANLSNDEVFTPPHLANQMLDMLPQELFEKKETTFLDPCCKSGVILREIAKRLIKGLEKEIPDLQERLNHIYTKQLYGMAITELTSLLSRRSLYCSKTANGKYSVCNDFEDEKGNIFFSKTQHTWKDGSCIYCGANQDKYDRNSTLETYAYQFIHNPKDLKDMKFDVIVGNPPYQLNVGNEGGNNAKAKAIYHHFISRAINLNSSYIVMITPSRWMTRSTEGIKDEWIDTMLKSNHFKIIHDFEDSSDCFPGVSIMGGVNYFLWERNYHGKCHYYFHKSGNKEILEREDFLDSKNAGIIIRDPCTYGIIEKIEKIEKEYICYENKNFTYFVSPKDYFTNKKYLTSSWDNFNHDKTGDYNIKYYINKNIHKIDYAWITKFQIPKHQETIPLHKIYIPAANGSKESVLGTPFYGEPNSVCSQTYLVIGYEPQKHNFSKTECENIISYIKTKFFRYLVSIKKKTQNGPRGVYQFVPIQDFNESWTDEKLYKKYNLSNDEIELIESSISQME